MSKKIKLLAFVALMMPVSVFGQLRVPKLVSDGMVLQRNAETTIWGWAKPGEEIAISFRDSTYQTITDENKKWAVTLTNLDAGGPYTMQVSTDTTITVGNIMIGDVWVSSGQSNMELTMERVRPLYESEIANAENDSIRYFDVPQEYNFQHPQNCLESGRWKAANSKNVLNFSAAAYSFAKRIHRKYGVPVGIINASVGGSPAESWISEQSLKKEFPYYFEEAVKYRDSSLIQNIQQDDQNRIDAWYKQLNESDTGYKGDTHWYDPDLNDGDWPVMNVPGYWSDPGPANKNGVFWFRKQIEIPKKMTGKPAKLLLGRIVDSDSVFVNGKFVGTTGYQYPPRRYDISPTILAKGKNQIAVRVINERGRGGFIPDKPYKLVVGDEEIDLKDKWKYRIGAEAGALEPQTFIRWKPLGLYNGMIAPIKNFRIRGVIWYQGESNTDHPVEYRDLFATLIRDWRKRWDRPDLPFLYVQLANFMEEKKKPV